MKEEGKSAPKPKQPKTDVFEVGKNTNWLTGQPDGKAKPSEITTTHKIGKGWK